MHRKAALMIRQSLEPDAAYADVALHGDGLTSLQFRPTAGAATSALASKRPADPVALYAATAAQNAKILVNFVIDMIRS